MFTYEKSDTNEEKPKNICFVDMLGRPTYDVAVLLCTSTTTEVRKTHLDSLLRYYHQELLSKVEELGHSTKDRYSLEDLLLDYQHSFPFALFFGIVNSQVRIFYNFIFLLTSGTN